MGLTSRISATKNGCISSSSTSRPTRFALRHAVGAVTVRVIDATTEFELQVEDTGVGIPADALSTIFDPYRQAHRDRGGTGLGLAIVKGVATAHGGK